VPYAGRSPLGVAVVRETIFQIPHLDPALRRGNTVFLWAAIPVVFGIGMWQVYLSEEVLPLPLSPRLFRGGVVIVVVVVVRALTDAGGHN
jgi:hypothetical protein